MSELIKKINKFFTSRLWAIDISSLNFFRSLLVTILRLIYTTIREFSDRELTLRAMSLVYTTLLSLIPLLAFSFSILKAFGVVDSQLALLLNNFLGPLGEKGQEVTEKILEFVANMKVGVLGFIGLLMLVYTVISLIKKIEDSFNHIWKIAKGRSIARKVSDYISITLLGPLLVFIIVGLTTNAVSNNFIKEFASSVPYGTMIFLFADKALSLILVCAVFSLFYLIIPNTKVKFGSALLGGFIAGISWQTTGWIFATLVASSGRYARYAAIYSSFAILILFMLWLYISWLIVLIGAEIAYCYQNLKYLSIKNEAIKLSNRLKEKLNLLIMYLISSNFHFGKQYWTMDSLVQHLGLPEDEIKSSITQLQNYNLITTTADVPHAYIPAKDIETIKLKDVLDSTRTYEEDRDLEEKYLSLPEIDRVSNQIESAIEKSLGNRSIKSLITSENIKD